VGAYVAGWRETCSCEQAARAGRQVNIATSARENIMGAHGETVEHLGEVQSNGRAW